MPIIEMKDLLQKLWDQYSETISDILDVMGNDSVDAYDESLDIITDDTNDMKKLRQDLIKAGIQDVGNIDIGKINRPTADPDLDDYFGNNS